MPSPAAAPGMDAGRPRRMPRTGCCSTLGAWAPAAMPLRLKMEKGKKKERNSGARELEGGRGLWPTSIAICIKLSPSISCCLARWTASFALRPAAAAIFWARILTY